MRRGRGDHVEFKFRPQIIGNLAWGCQDGILAALSVCRHALRRSQFALATHVTPTPAIPGERKSEGNREELGEGVSALERVIRGSASRYTAPMRLLQTLTFEAFRAELATTFAQIADQRDPHRITWEMPAVLMSAFAMLFFQHPSLLEYQRRMQQRTGRSNLERVFQVEEIPSDTQMREILDGVPRSPYGGCCRRRLSRCGGWGGRHGL